MIRRRSLSGIVGVAAVAASLALASVPAVAQAPLAIATAEARDTVNAVRRDAGLPPLDNDPLLMALATQQALAMATAGTMSHTVAGSLQQRLATGGYGARTAAENIGYGQATLAEVFSSWMQSPPHRANILNRQMTAFGIGGAFVNGATYWAIILADPR